MIKEEKRAFFNLQVELNDICNLECKHCYQIRLKNKEELDVDIILEQLEEFKKVSGYDKFYFRLSGGEATLRKDLFRIINKLLAQNHYVELITNGIFLDLPYSYALKATGLHMVQISLDGATEETHDFIRGKGSFAKTIKGIKNMVKLGIPVEVKFTLIKNVNTHEIREMYRLCSELQINFLAIGRFIFAGNGVENLKEGNLIGNELKEVFYNIIEEARNFPDLLIRVRDQLVRIVDKVDNIEIPPNVNIAQRPYMGRSYLAFDTYGNVYADRQLDIIIGNIHKKTISEIWLKSKKLSKLKNSEKHLMGKCITCNINQICLGGNKTASYGITGDPFQPDPGCWL
ncbi:MAG: radical SAM protein [Cyanobacteriota bacterium]